MRGAVSRARAACVGVACGALAVAFGVSCTRDSRGAPGGAACRGADCPPPPADAGVDTGAGDPDLGDPPPPPPPPPDLGPPDLGFDYRDAAPVEACTVACGERELCGDMGDGNGLDDDCDGRVDEDCVCTAGTSRACFVGPPDRRNIGVCADGVMQCTEFLQWGPCLGGQFPTPEVCDGADNDCNALEDDGLVGCASTLACPGSEAAAPLARHALVGSRIYGGAARAWRWEIECPSTVSPCPTPEDPSAADTGIFFVQSGNYRARLTVETADGDALSCAWVIYVQGAGLRVELLWDTQGAGRGDTDVDLHLHRKSLPPGITVGETAFFNSDDCYYANCKASSYEVDLGFPFPGLPPPLRTRWSLPDTTDLDVCASAPHGEGALWRTRHRACFNPRLDVDVISCDPAVTDPNDDEFCAPENINVDNPPNGSVYRVMVNYYSSNGHTSPTYPTVNIYCGGELRGTFGTDPVVSLTGTRSGRLNDSWLVADVQFFTDSCGRVTCAIEPLGTTKVFDGSFGPPWSF